MLQDVKDLTAPGVIKGLNTQYNFLTLSKDQSPNMMDVKVNYDGSFEKRLGSTTQNSVIIASSAVANFSPNSANLLLTRAISYWNLDEVSGTRYDSIGSNSLLSSGNTVGFTSGKKNQAALFYANSQNYLYSKSVLGLMGSGHDITFSSWIYLNSTSTTLERAIISKGGQNSISNGTFETWTAGPSAAPDNWAIAGVGASVAREAVTIKAGTYSAKLIGNADGQLYNSFENPAGINYWKGKTLTMGCWVYATGANAQIGLYDAASATNTTHSAASGWEYLTVTHTVSASATVLWARCLLSQPSTTAYFDEAVVSEGLFPQGAEYYLYVNTDNIPVFKVSSSGYLFDNKVVASSFGALTTATWYNVVAWHSTGSHIGISVNLSQNTAAYTSLIPATSSQFLLGKFSANSAQYFDGAIDITGVWNKLLSTQEKSDLYNSGSGNEYGAAFLGYPWAAFDFGASSIRWLTVSAGTGVYASSNLGLTWVNIGTSQSATYQYFDRSKNVLIKTSDAYDRPLYWAGSAGTYLAEIGNSAPLCKYSANFQGFLILLNSSTRKRSFNYIDENFQLSSTAWLNFDLPSSADDEITAVFILRRYLYVSTRYKIYRVSYVGGNPDWQYVEVKSWGFIPRTAKKVVIMNNQQGQTSAYSIGEVIVGLTYDRKLRIFDGSGDQLLSSNVEKDNGMCDFALDKITYLGSGPVISFAELDPIPNVYRLCVAIGQNSQQTTHFLNYDGRSQALYPYSNMNFNCMTVAESANRQYLMAFDRVGYCHMMDSGNLDGGTTAINDFFESPLMFDKTPSQSSKGHKTDLFFSGTTSGRVYYQDRTDFSNVWKDRKSFVLSGSDNKLVDFIPVDVPETYNTYQFRITSSSGTNNPWRLQRYDHFTKGLGIGKGY